MAAGPRPEALGDDPTRRYSAAEEGLLAENLRVATRAVYGLEANDAIADRTLLTAIHRQLFDGVRGHAGCVRSSDFGSEYLTFGPNRSAHRDHVPEQVDRICGQVQRAIASFDATPDAADYEVKAIHVAVWAHAELIRVHPFEDGNGRSTRLFCDWILIRLGLRPIPVESEKTAYIECLNRYFDSGDLQLLLDLYIRLYPFDPI